MRITSIGRRVDERFDVLGSLWGVLELPETATVLNVSSSGLLVETPLCPTLNSVHVLRMLVDGDFVTVNSVVRHCRPGPSGTYLVGLELLEVPTTVINSIEQLGADKQIEVIDAGASRS